jgi:Peptidase family U32
MASPTDPAERPRARHARMLEAAGMEPPERPGPESSARFDDGLRAHFEIASVEGPVVLRAVLDEAAAQGVRVHRVSQGSGVMMLSDGELDEVAALGREHDLEVCLFLGPRGGWDIGGQALVTDAAAGVARGPEAVEACVAEADRACAHGIRSLLVGDIGVLDVLARLRSSGHLPSDLRFKTSAVMCAANPATAALYDRLGADTINVATDLSVGMLAAMRRVTRLPLDLYIEAPDDLGGFVRSYEVPDIVRVAAPVHLKFGLRNARSVYPSGGHLEDVAVAQAREKVRRAALAERLLRELAPELAP